MSNVPERSDGDTTMSDEDRSKDAFYDRVAELANAMIAAHGKEFAMGTLVLAARFIAEGKSLGGSEAKGSETEFGAAPTPPQ